MALQAEVIQLHLLEFCAAQMTVAAGLMGGCVYLGAGRAAAATTCIAYIERTAGAAGISRGARSAAES